MPEMFFAIIVTVLVIWYFQPVLQPWYLIPTQEAGNSTSTASIGMDELQLLNEKITTMEQFNELIDKLNQMESKLIKSKVKCMQHILKLMDELEKAYDDKVIDKMEAYDKKARIQRHKRKRKSVCDICDY
eukprot:473872_1